MRRLRKFGKVAYNYPLANLVTFKVGGPAKAVVWVETEEQLLGLIDYLIAIECPYYILGRGSNVLPLDEGFAGVVIVLKLNQWRWERESNNVLLNVSAGMKISDILGLCIKYGWDGISFMAGIPGTIGGAVKVNAGTAQMSIGERIKRVKIFSVPNEVRWISWESDFYGYRYTKLARTDIILKAEIGLKSSPSFKVQNEIRKFFLQKKQTQPLFMPSAGCVFKNLPGISAGFLIEKTGLKGKCIGGACVSPKHANFIVNTGNARAKDVLDLMNLVRERVKRKTGVLLEPEIEILL